MGTPLLRTKLHPPAIAPDLVPRPELLQALEERRRLPLTLVSAPAGYGKSSLVRSWLEASGANFAWLSLNESENDPQIFLSYILGALSNMIPGFGRELSILLGASTPPPPDRVVHGLLNSLADLQEESVLVLDDYHSILDPEVHEIIAAILRSPPRHLHLALLTRRDPPLPIHALRGRGQVHEISVRELRFSREETEEFLRSALGGEVESTDLDIVDKQLEGWVAGLRLVSQALRDRRDLHRLTRGLKGGFASIVEYLIAEVLSHQEAEIETLLLETSILERFCVPLCEAVGGDSLESMLDGFGRPGALLEKNLFVIPLDEEHRWFRFHHMFRDVLRLQLQRRRDPAEIATLHVRASAWLEENGWIDEAIHHALEADDPKRAAKIVERHRFEPLNEDRILILRRWLDRIPEAVAAERPGILLAHAWVLEHRAEQEKMPDLLDRVEALLELDEEESDLRWEVDTFRGMVAWWTAEHARAIQLLDRALGKGPEEAREVHGRQELYRAVARQMAGEGREAITELEEAIHRDRSGSDMLLSRRIAAQAFVHLLEGDLPSVVRTSRRVREVARRAGFAYTESWCDYWSGISRFQSYELEKACESFRAVHRDRYLLHAYEAVGGLAGLAIANQALGQEPEADAAVRDLHEYVEESRIYSSLAIVESCTARVSLWRGDLDSAARLLSHPAPPLDPQIFLFHLEVTALTRCRVLLATGTGDHVEEAFARLAEIGDLVKATHNTFQAIDTLVLTALAYRMRSRWEDARRTLEQAVALAEPGGWVRPFVEGGPLIAELLRLLAVGADGPGHLGVLLRHVEDDSESATTPTPAADLLTNREHEVLALLAKGLSNKEIAAKLYRSPETVKKHVYNIYTKLEVHSRFDALTRARELGLIQV